MVVSADCTLRDVTKLFRGVCMISKENFKNEQIVKWCLDAKNLDPNNAKVEFVVCKQQGDHQSCVLDPETRVGTLTREQLVVQRKVPPPQYKPGDAIKPTDSHYKLYQSFVTKDLQMKLETEPLGHYIAYPDGLVKQPTIISFRDPGAYEALDGMQLLETATIFHNEGGDREGPRGCNKHYRTKEGREKRFEYLKEENAHAVVFQSAHPRENSQGKNTYSTVGGFFISLRPLNPNEAWCTKLGYTHQAYVHTFVKSPVADGVDSLAHDIFRWIKIYISKQDPETYPKITPATLHTLANKTTADFYKRKQMRTIGTMKVEAKGYCDEGDYQMVKKDMAELFSKKAMEQSGFKLESGGLGHNSFLSSFQAEDYFYIRSMLMAEYKKKLLAKQARIAEQKAAFKAGLGHKKKNYRRKSSPRKGGAAQKRRRVVKEKKPDNVQAVAGGAGGGAGKEKQPEKAKEVGTGRRTSGRRRPKVNYVEVEEDDF